MDEAAEEIENLREAIRRLADQDATLSVCGGAVQVTMDETLTDEERAATDMATARLSAANTWLQEEIKRLRLTDSERFVLREVRDIYADEDDVKCNEIAAVIDWLLERTK